MREATHTPHIKTAEDMLAKMRAGVKEVYEIRVRDLIVPVRVLSVDEMNAVRHESLKKAMLGDDVDRALSVQKSTLLLASTIGGKNALPTMSEKFLGLLSTDEINHLYNEYIKVLEDVNPSIQSLSNDEFRALVEAIKKKEFGSKDCSLHQLRAIFTAFQDLILKQEIQRSQTVN